jgi:hypothetical protein
VPEKRRRIEREDLPEEPAEIVESAAAVGGALAGSAVTLLAGPFVGSSAGELVGRALRRVGVEIQRRRFGPQQERRVGEAFEGAVVRSREALEAGSQPRDDGFFEADEGGRSDAEELLEGVLLHAADAYEERKVKHLGALYSSLTFRSDVSPAYANYLLNLADRVTYRQLAWLALIRSDGGGRLAQLQVAKQEGDLPPLAPGLGAEIDDLSSSLYLVGVAQPGGEVARAVDLWGGSDFGNLDWGAVTLTPLGSTLYDLMKLDEIPASEPDAIVESLRSGAD